MSLSIHHSILKHVLYCTASLLLIAGEASAKTQTESFTTAAQLGCSQYANNFILPSFDPTLGTLESVDVTLKFSSCSSINVFNAGCSPVSFTNASILMPIAVTGSNGFDFNTSLTASLPSGIANPGMNNFWNMESSTTGKPQIDPSTLDLWESQPGGQISFDVSKGNNTYQGTAPGNDLLFGGKSHESGKITVEYTYLSSGCPGSGNSGNLATPEPSGKYLSAIVAAAMMLIVIGRRKLLSA